VGRFFGAMLFLAGFFTLFIQIGVAISEGFSAIGNAWPYFVFYMLIGGLLLAFGVALMSSGRSAR